MRRLSRRNQLEQARAMAIDRGDDEPVDKTIIVD